MECERGPKRDSLLLASNGWLAARFDMGRPASVSQYVRRFRLARDAAAPDFQATLSKVKI